MCRVMSINQPYSLKSEIPFLSLIVAQAYLLLSGQVLRSGIILLEGLLVEAAFQSRLVGEGAKSCQG